MGFFSIGFRCLDVPDDCGLSNTLLKRLDRAMDNARNSWLSKGGQ